jgi:hypothetical protein
LSSNNTGSSIPPWWVHWQYPHKVTREKRKRKETNKKKLQQTIKSQTMAKSKITWRKQVSNPLGKGNSSTHPRQNYAQAKSANHQTEAPKTTKSSRCTHASPPSTNATAPGRMHAKHHLKTGSYNNSVLIGQNGHHHRSDRCSTCAQDQPCDRSDRWPRPVKPVHIRAQKLLKTTWKPSKCIQQAISSSNSPPPLVGNAWINHWTMLRWIWAILRKICLSRACPKHGKNISK